MDGTRERILEKALSLMAATGYNAVGVQDICDAAEVTKPTLYYHFGSKRGLLEAIAEERYGVFVSQATTACSYRGDLAASLRSAMEVFLRYGREEKDFSRLRLALSSAPPSSEEAGVVRPYREKLRAAFRGTFVAAAGDHGNMKNREVPYAASFVGVADAYVGLVLSGELVPDQDFITRVVHYFMHGIFS